ncbi:MAG TPA: hypothetical protein VKA19_11480 [Alphaproteobacteria bacterium]|nr:hypothetical protein [Alphaproteobacteria bacterium]
MTDRPDLRFFRPEEFRGWFEDMSLRLLVLNDSLRFRWGAPIQISPHPAAIGRRLNRATTQHNIELWGEVRAVDQFPRGMTTRGAAERFLAIATSCGFTGIGIYPYWQRDRDADPEPGVHVDVRVDREPGDPATWGGIPYTDQDGKRRQRYVSLSEALDRLD